jgi:hypothetical protein
MTQGCCESGADSIITSACVEVITNHNGKNCSEQRANNRNNANPVVSLSDRERASAEDFRPLAPVKAGTLDAALKQIAYNLPELVQFAGQMTA